MRDVSQRGQVQLTFKPGLPGKRHGSRVLNNERVRPRVTGKARDKSPRRSQVVAFEHRVEGDVYLPLFRPGKIRKAGKIRERKVLRLHPRRKMLKA